MRLIDADALIDVLTQRCCKNCDKRMGTKNGKRRMIYEIGEAPCRACYVDDVKMELDEAPTINEKKIIKDFLLKCSKICNDDCDKCPMYIQRAYDEKLCFFDFFDNFQFLDNVRKLDDVITGVLDYEAN